jgi:hypothetical protein
MNYACWWLQLRTLKNFKFGKILFFYQNLLMFEFFLCHPKKFFVQHMSALYDYKESINFVHGKFKIFIEVLELLIDKK